MPMHHIKSNHRQTTKKVNIGCLTIGGGSPIVVQSMTSTDTRNISETLAQINRLSEAGCELVRLAVPDKTAAAAFGEIKKQTDMPLAADIHYDHRLAILSIENGADKLRINPGNIGGKEKTALVVQKAREKNIPIRIGVNAGSLEKDILAKYGGITAEGIVESALRHIEILEDLHYDNIVIALKASSVPLTIEAYRLIAEQTSYPLHVGITETGTLYGGSIKSAAGIGTILSHGIGDTIRVSLTGDPVEEVKCAKEILKAMELRRYGVEFISCPTCGRTEIDLVSIANAVEQQCGSLTKNIKVAVMGCVVNGPGEARDADIGIAGGKGCGVIFRNGELIRKVSENELVAALMDEIALL